MMADANSPLHLALKLWQEITGVDPSANSGTLAKWHLRETFDALQEAIKLDPTQVTFNLLLTHFVNEHLAGQAVSLLDLLDHPEDIEARLAKPRELLAILNRPQVVDARESFIASLRAALGSYGAADRDDVNELLSQPDDVAILRRDALRSVERLRLDQFLDGEPEPATARPVYNRTVHQWWNINSMLVSTTRMPSGVSLNLIRHPDAFQSYFCFAIRNGGNLFVLTDVPDHSHPLQGYMSRRPDRHLDRRASRNWFPYDLLGLEYDEENKRLYVRETKQRGLVAYQNVALPLQPVAELPAAELVWLCMMFDLIVEKFWRRGFKAPALSYTAEMLKAEHTLIEVAKSGNLPVRAYQPVSLPALTKADVGAAASSEQEVGKKYHQPNRWLEERYGDRVADSVLNVIGSPEQGFALERESGTTALVDPAYNTLSEGQQHSLLAGRTPLVMVDATSFGSRDQIAADRKFIARANFATSVNLLAQEEFAARKEAVHTWYCEKVRANASALVRWAANHELWVDDGVHESNFTSYHHRTGGHRSVRLTPDAMHSKTRLLRRFLKRLDLATDETPWDSFVTLGQTDVQGRPLCYLNGTKASYWALFYPASEQELALLAGCEVAELPDVLQHWRLLNVYTGNCILDRVDPMIWRVKNPWLTLNLAVRLGFSKRAMARIEKLDVQRPVLPNLLTEVPA